MKNQIIIALWITFSVVACKHDTSKEKLGKDNLKTTDLNLLSKQEKVERTIIQLNNAMVNEDSVQLGHLTSKDLIYGHSSGLTQNKSEFIEDVVHGSLNFSAITNPEQSVHIVDRVAIVRHIFEAKATNKGEVVDIRIGNMQVYQENDEGKWKLLARQAYKLPN